MRLGNVNSHVRVMLEFEGYRNDMHGFNSVHDLITQERLLEADDEFFNKEILDSQIRKCRFHKNGVVNSDTNPVSSNLLNNNGNKSNNAQKLAREFRTAPLCGWSVDPNVIYRKNNGPSKSKGALGKEYTSSRDLKNKSNTSQDFIFRHYTDIKLYIEQYRKEHICWDVTSLSATRTDLLESRRPYIGNEYPPLAVCTEINTPQQITTLPSSQQEGSTVLNTKQQYQKPQCLSGQYTSKQEQQIQTFRARNLKKSYSPSSTLEICKAAFLPEQSHATGSSERGDSHATGRSERGDSHATGRSERGGSPKAAVVNKAASVVVRKSEFAAMKIPTSKIVPTKIVKLLGPGSPPEPDNRGMDPFTDSSGSGSEKESSGVQATDDIPKAQLELCSLVNKQDSKPEPSRLFMTNRRGEDCLQTSTIQDFSKTMQFIQPMHVSNKGSDSLEKDVTSSSFHKNAADKSIHGTGKMCEQNLPRKEGSPLAVTGHDCYKTKKYVYDRWTVAKKQDVKSLISHNRRIRHLIAQSKLKYKFEPNANLSKPSSRRFLEINSIQITDPFVKAVPFSNQIRNMDNCEQNIYNGLHCSSFTEATVSCNSIQGSTMGVNSRVKMVQNGNPAFCEEMPNSFLLEGLKGFDCPISNGRYTKTNFRMNPCPKNCFKSGAAKDGLFEVDQSLFSHSKLVRDNKNTNCGQTLRDTSWENAFENCFPRNNTLKMSKDKCYVHKLAEEVSTMVTFSLPKVKHSQFPLVCRSQSLEF